MHCGHNCIENVHNACIVDTIVLKMSTMYALWAQLLRKCSHKCPQCMHCGLNCIENVHNACIVDTISKKCLHKCPQCMHCGLNCIENVHNACIVYTIVLKMSTMHALWTK